MKITILGKEYNYKYSLRAMFIFEEIANKPFQIQKMLDTYILFYSCIASVKDNPALDFNDFIDYCSDHPECLTEFTDYLTKETEKRNLYNNDDKKKVENL